MPRGRLIRTPMFPYHITSRVHRKRPFPIPIEQVWRIFLNELKYLQESEKFELFAFVLMPNHIHMLIQTPKSNLDRIMYFLMKNTALKILRKSKLTDNLWGKRYHWSHITGAHYYHNVYKYVLRNPVKAGLCQSFLDYEFALHPYSKNYKKIQLKNFIEEDVHILKEWIDDHFPLQDEVDLKAAIKKKIFSYRSGSSLQEFQAFDFTPNRSTQNQELNMIKTP